MVNLNFKWLVLNLGAEKVKILKQQISNGGSSIGTIVNRENLAEQAAKWHGEKIKVVLTNGCFDILHMGHLRTFKEAKAQGDILVVGLNSDESIRGLKGETRPIIPQNDRLELLAALEPIDYVTLFDEATAVRLIELIKPQVYVKGGDYNLNNLPEKDVLLRYQVEVKFIPLVTGISTTEMIKRIRTANI
ncbi:MAG TPA: D-glycero-beta-D-manno-heptose 1-phosphate adenylyltransferase [Firmicutes bacterium]|nr:D-glycero-beta-D-manno-heptose 1-phosphate adenylyltransferase [Bacillota bacterium]